MKRFKKAYLEITNVCNLSCSFCHGTTRTPEFISIEEFQIYASELREFTDYLYLHVMGEPLLHPKLETILSFANSLGFRVIITTNGTLLQKQDKVLRKASCLDKINISLHSFEANAASIDFNAYIGQCIACAESSTGYKVNFRLWNKGGLECRNEEILNLLETAFPKPWGRTRDGYKLSPNTYLQFADMFIWPDYSEQDYGGRGFCFGLRDQIAVLCDGTVVPCCLDSDGTIVLGNLKNQSLNDILNSERACNLYNGFSKRKRVEELCRHCQYATRFSKT